MIYIFGLFLLVLLFIVLHFFTEIPLKQKLIVSGTLVFVILGAYLFNQNNETRRVLLESVLLNYMHGATITCDKMDVNNSEYSYSSGTQTFLGKKESKMFGRIISLDQCQ